MTELRVAVLGAGVAGLAAARALSEAGVRVDLFEARDRLGGRVLGLRGVDWPLPIELGAEFVHGESEVMSELLKEAELELNEMADTHHWRPPGREVRAVEPLVELPDFWQQTERILSKVEPGAPDTSAAEFAARSGLSHDERCLFEMFVEGYHAAPFDDVSIQSLARDAQAASGEAPPQSRIAGGYGRLVDWLAERAIASGRTDIHLNSRVRQVLWGPGEVRLEVEDRAGAAQRSARALVVTAPVSVLRAAPNDGGIGFDPPLREKHAAWGLAGVGHVAKVMLLFREQFWDDRVSPDWEFLHDPASRFFTFWRQSSDNAQQITAWAGGPRALAMAGRRNMELVQDALGTLAALLGVRPRHAESLLVGAHLHAFSEDRFARGAYGYARVGGEKVHAALAAPLAQTLFFGGEATDSDHPATVGGALASGQRAARELLRVL